MTGEAIESQPPSAPSSSDRLGPVLREIAEKIARHRGANIGEQNTKLTLINPVLRALGWNVEDLEDVRHEFRRAPADRPVDYALMLARTPKLFVEAKALDEDLEDRRWANQIISYAAVAGVEWVVLTNGDEYRVYNALAHAPVEEKLFRMVQISADPEPAAEALLLLTKEQIQENALGGLWRAYAIDRRVKEAVETLFAPDPNAWLVGRLARSLDGLTPSDVRAALARARLVLDFPPQEQPLSSRRRVPSLPEPDGPEKKQRRPRRPGEVSAVTLRQLIDSGLIHPPLDLVRQYKGHELRGRIEADGRVSFAGKSYDSLSTAAGMARASIRGAPPGRKYPQTNGWTWWRFRDTDGEYRELNVLRERFVAKRRERA